MTKLIVASRNFAKRLKRKKIKMPCGWSGASIIFARWRYRRLRALPDRRFRRFEVRYSLLPRRKVVKEECCWVGWTPRKAALQFFSPASTFYPVKHPRRSKFSVVPFVGKKETYNYITFKILSFMSSTCVIYLTTGPQPLPKQISTDCDLVLPVPISSILSCP